MSFADFSIGLIPIIQRVDAIHAVTDTPRGFVQDTRSVCVAFRGDDIFSVFHRGDLRVGGGFRHNSVGSSQQPRLTLTATLFSSAAEEEVVAGFSALSTNDSITHSSSLSSSSPHPDANTVAQVEPVVCSSLCTYLRAITQDVLLP